MRTIRMHVVLFFLAVLTSLQGQAQTGRTVTLTWTDTVNPPTTTYSVKRANGLCTGTPTFNTITTGVAAKTYADVGVAVGNYCYIVTATIGGFESAPSNTAGATALPKEPVITNVQVAVLDREAPKDASGTEQVSESIAVDSDALSER